MAFLVFLVGIGGPSLWIDEGHTWQSAHNQDYRGAAELVTTDCASRISYDGMSRDAMVYYLQQKPCAPSESMQSDRLWVVQAAGPQVTEPGYTLVRTTTFGMAIVTYWVAK